MTQLELPFQARQPAKEEPAPAPAPPTLRTRFPVIGQDERWKWKAIWPPPAAIGRDFDLRLEEDSFADQLFALGPFPATDEASDFDEPFLPSKPTKRRECASGPRPCPWVSCRHHLYLDVRADGSLKLNFPEKEPDELPVSCSLDLAEDGPRTLDSIAAIMGMSKERARQLETAAFDKLYVSLPRALDTEMTIEEEWI